MTRTASWWAALRCRPGLACQRASSGSRVRPTLYALSLATAMLGPGCHRAPHPVPPLTGRAAAALALCKPQIRPNEWATFNGYLQGALDHVQSTGRAVELPAPAAAMSPEARSRDLTRRLMAAVRPKLGSAEKTDVFAQHAVEAAMRAVEEQRTAKQQPALRGRSAPPHSRWGRPSHV